ncbi:MAG TPA: pyridoxamine 5'-phosphate oxidase [Flavisolibacter sp.]|jgi:pyridoxamine 5'-phosphate oxidase|nr:pyridoxamine 5'-phosphate oxidase [Flavisolibacter sp.]
MNTSIASIRKDYAAQTLLESDVAPLPVDQFSKWWQQATESAIEEVNAMTLATASADGMPSARIVLLKDFDARGFVFFTNYQSFKGMQLEENPKACLVFFWKELERQVRITGLVSRIEEKESDAYFLSRPKGSQIGAWTSPQSQVIENRDWLELQYKKKEEQFEHTGLKRPPHWGGFRVQPVIMEFWQGRPSRLHDRIQYTLESDNNWKIERLAP